MGEIQNCQCLVANLERAYGAMWQRFNAGEEPAAFAVSETA